MTKLACTSVISLIFIFIIGGCISDPDFADAPQLTYIGLSKSQMAQSSLPTDSLDLLFSFTDGDGDIGSDLDNAPHNVILTDNRTGVVYDSIRIQMIPILGASKGVSGEVAIRIYTTCCIFPDPNIPPCESPDQHPTDTLTIDLILKDNSNNISNVITTEPIILLCN